MRFPFFIFIITTLCSIAFGSQISDIVEKAKKNNPEIKEIQEKLKKYRYKEDVEGSLPDTVFSFAVNDIQLFYRPLDRNIEPMQSLSFGISQKVPFIKKLKTKRDIVKKSFSIETLNLKIKEQEILKNLYISLYKIWLYREKLKILKEYQEVLKGIIKLSNISYTVGKASQSDVINSQMYYTKLKEKEIKIKSLLNQETVKAKAIIGKDLKIPYFTIKQERLEKTNFLIKSIDRSPYLEKIRLQTKKQKERIKLAQLNLYPDFTFFAKYFYRKSFNDYISAGISITLPFLNKKKHLSEIIYQKTEKKVLEKKYTSEKIKLISQIKENIFKYEETEETYRILKTLLFQSQKSFETVLSEFKVGKKNMVDVLFSLKQLITLKEEILENIFNRNVTVIRIKSLLGELK